MTVRIWLLIVVSATLVAWVGLTVAERFAARLAAHPIGFGVPIAAGVIARTIKTRRQRETRSTAPDSVEAAADEKSRAGAFLDAIYATLAAMAISAFADEMAAVIVCVVSIGGLPAVVLAPPRLQRPPRASCRSPIAFGNDGKPQV